MSRYQTKQRMGMNEDEYYEVHAARYPFIEKRIAQLNLPSSAKALDVGCFPPRLYEFMEDLGLDVHGIAFETEQVLNDKIKLLDIQKNTLPWPENFFDLIVFTEVIEHLPFDPLFTLQELHRVLKPKGMLILSTPNFARLQNIILLTLGQPITYSLDQLLSTKHHDGSIYQRHNKEFVENELLSLLERAGFKKKALDYVTFYPPTRKRVQKRSLLSRAINWMGYLPQLFVPRFRDSMFAVVEK